MREGTNERTNIHHDQTQNERTYTTTKHITTLLLRSRVKKTGHTARNRKLNEWNQVNNFLSHDSELPRLFSVMNLMISIWLILHIFFSAAVGEEPEFVEDIENVTVPVGRNVKLACSVRNLGTYKVKKKKE